MIRAAPLTALLIGLTAATPLAPAVAAKAPDPAQTAGGIAFGAYDPSGDFAGDASVAFEHLFVPWQDVDLASFATADAYARQRGRSVLITVEPWSWAAAAPSVDRPALRAAILTGRDDATMAAICRAAGEMTSKVTIRWGHEMEDRNGRFPWSAWAPPDYVAAYRRMVDVCRENAPGLQFMWSPKGDYGLQPYYPGDAFVDEIGLSVFGLEAWDVEKYGHARSFVEAVQPAYERVAGFGKPVVVAELGYSGSADYVARWADDSRKSWPALPRLSAVSYFNQRDAAAWPDCFGHPDWRLAHRIVSPYQKECDDRRHDQNF